MIEQAPPRAKVSKNHHRRPENAAGGRSLAAFHDFSFFEQTSKLVKANLCGDSPREAFARSKTGNSRSGELE